MYKNGLRVKPTAALENVTKSSRVDGFTFVGSGNLAFSSTKGIELQATLAVYQTISA